MATPKSAPRKKYFTVAEANASLPLVRAILQDITTLAHGLRERYERLAQTQPSEHGSSGQAHREEWEQMHAEFERDQERMQAFVDELGQLGVELKDYYTGLIDFPSWMNNREVYLCYKLGEPAVGHWHELDAGFAGRRKLPRTDDPQPCRIVSGE